MAISQLNNNAAPPILSEPGSAVAEGVHPIWIRTIGPAVNETAVEKGSARNDRMKPKPTGCTTCS